MEISLMILRDNKRLEKSMTGLKRQKRTIDKFKKNLTNRKKFDFKVFIFNKYFSFS